MKERPILFSGPMVRAILSGAKTITRRLVKPQPAHSCRYEMNGAGDKALHLATGTHGEMLFVPWKAKSEDHRLPCPYGGPGDRLWVREAWASIAHGRGFGIEIHYRADGHDFYNSEQRAAHQRVLDPAPDKDDKWRHVDGLSAWRNPLFMPRWASRITLEVTGVRVERLHDISEDDAKAEGLKVTGPTVNGAGEVIDDRPGYLGYGSLWYDPRRAFETIWDSINGKRAPWSSNPWTWVVEFKVANVAGRKEVA